MPNEFIIMRAHSGSKGFSRTTSTKSQCAMDITYVCPIWSVSCKLGNIKGKTPENLEKNCSQSRRNIFFYVPLVIVKWGITTLIKHPQLYLKIWSYFPRGSIKEARLFLGFALGFRSGKKNMSMWSTNIYYRTQNEVNINF